MSENKKVTDNRSEDRKQVDEWMNGSGQLVLGIVGIVLVLWFIVSIFW